MEENISFDEIGQVEQEEEYTTIFFFFDNLVESRQLTYPIAVELFKKIQTESLQ